MRSVSGWFKDWKVKATDLHSTFIGYSTFRHKLKAGKETADERG
jgi:hypothetical protein